MEKKDLYIPEGIKNTNIGEYAYELLNNVFIPKSLEYIDMSTFEGSTVKNVLFSNGNCHSIYCAAFCECYELENIVFSDKIKLIDEYAFSYCRNLRKLILPNGIETIRKGAFINCEKISEIVFPNHPITIEDEAFFDCASLKEIKINVDSSLGNCFNTTVEIKIF